MRTTPRMLLALVAALALGLAACGGGSDTPVAPTLTGAEAMQLIAASPDKVAEAQSARLAMTMAYGGGDLSGSFTMDGAFDTRSGDGSFSMDLGELGGSIEMRVVDGVTFMQAGGIFGSILSLPDGVEWLRLDPAALASDMGLEGMTGMGTTDPSSLTGQFEALRGISGSVREVGTEEVRGASTTHYAVEIDLAKALDEVPAAQRDQVRAAYEQLGLDTFPADVWIDGEGRMRKFEFTFDGSTLGGDSGSGGASATMTMEMYDFGTDVSVEAPPADATADFADVFGGMLGGLGDALNGVGSSGASA